MTPPPGGTKQTNWRAELVRLSCLKLGCPRTRWIERDDAMPKRTASVKDFCPWHQESGTKGESAQYFRKDGVQVMWEPSDD